MRKTAETSRKMRTLTILCLVFVCALALLLRGVLIYKLYPLNYQDEIKKYSGEYSLDEYLVCAVINTESHFDADIKSSKGAVGLMQILPSTGEWAAKKIGIEKYTEASLTDPKINIRIGCWYLNYLSGLFEGNLDHILAAYNAGPSTVKDWIASDEKLKSIPFEETENYLEKVKSNYEIYKRLYKDF